MSSRRLASLVRASGRLRGTDDEAEGRSDAGAADGASLAETSVAEPAEPRPPVRQWRRVGRAMVRPGRGQLVAAVVLCLLGLAGVMQIRANASDDAYGNARREDLVSILDGLGTESRRLETEIADLQQTRTELQSGADTQQVAREDAQNRVEELEILAGTAPAQGSGIRMRISDPQRKVDANVLLDAVEEMRDSGAEVIEIDDRARVVASTWFGDDGMTLLVDGNPVSRPLTIEVIGDPHSLEEAARFRGGIVSEITGPKIGGDVQVEEVSDLVVTSLHAAPTAQYARPATSGPTPR